MDSKVYSITIGGNFKRELKLFVFWLLLFFATTSCLYVFVGIPDDFLFLLTNLLIMALTFLGSGWKPLNYFSLTKMVLVFFYFFFGVVPLVNFVDGNVYWGAKPVPSSAQSLTNLIIIIGIFSFLLGSFFSVRVKLKQRFKFQKFSSFRMFVFLIFSICSFLVYLSLVDFNILAVIFRGIEGDSVDVNSSSLAFTMFSNGVLRYIPFIAFLILLVESKSVRYYKMRVRFFLFLMFVTALVSSPPTGVSRYVVATLYIPLVIISTRLWAGAYRMQLSLLFGLMIVMPFLNKFRYFNSDSFSWSVDLSSFKEGHFDAYQNFSKAVEESWITWGEQLLGVIFFFVPRSYWPSKPIGSGAQIANDLNFSFSNISMPYMAEWYINFSIVGVVIGMSGLGLLLGSADRTYWSLSVDERNSRISVFYYLLFGLIFFMMRGDLMSSFAYLVGFSISFSGVLIVFNLIFRTILSNNILIKRLQI